MGWQMIETLGLKSVDTSNVPQDKVIVDFPDREDIETLTVGDMAIDCFGGISRVVRVSCCKEDIHGKLFVCYATDFGKGASITMSRKEDELTRTVGLSRYFTSHECDDIEDELRARPAPWSCPRCGYDCAGECRSTARGSWW